MNTLKVSVAGIVSGLNQCLKTSLHQGTDTTAKDCLLTKEVCLSLCAESSLQDTCSCSTDTKAVSQSIAARLSCVRLLSSY